MLAGNSGVGRVGGNGEWGFGAVLVRDWGTGGES